MPAIRNLLIAIISAAWIATPSWAQLASPIPGNADVGRIDRNRELPFSPPIIQQSSSVSNLMQTPVAPDESKKIRFKLQRVTINGAHALTQAQIRPVYANYLKKTISLDTAWLIAEKITRKYQQNGFFLSRAYVPKQQIADGEISISVVEGYIAEVVIDKSFDDNEIVQEWIQAIKQQRPITSDYLESVLLQINDIPGVSLRATLEPIKSNDVRSGAVRMVLTQQKVVDHGRISYDNNGSKFLGPLQLSAQYETSLIEGQRTTVSFLTSTPTRELQFGTIRQHIAAFAGGYADLYAGYTKAYPGHSIRSSDIQSNSLTFGAALSYQLIRQRQENLLTRLAFETRDTESDILSSTPLTRDHIRALRASANYETMDPLQGTNQVNVTVSQGLNILESSQKGNRNLSRAEATPDFTKAEFSFARNQPIDEDYSIVSTAMGQISSGPLYSAEEFGYGGLGFGRAYDASELTGDHGIAGALELRYFGLDMIEGIKAVPYSFYDAGAVFNDDRTQKKSEYASSAGFGVRINSELGATANIAAAFPLIRDIGSPIHRNNGPRYVLEIGYGF